MHVTAPVLIAAAAVGMHVQVSTKEVDVLVGPLELLHPKHRRRLAFTLGGTSTITGLRVQELRYRELTEPSLIRDAKGSAMLAHGSVWLASDRRVVRVTLHLRHADRAAASGPSADNELRVDFAINQALGILVPRELREEFELPGNGRCHGRATYSRFRRFTTSTTIIPPP